jgi:hypothetical protein
VFNNNLNQLIASVGTQILNNSLPAQAGPVSLSIGGLSPSGLLGIRLQLAIKGSGLVSLKPFTCVPLSSQQVTGDRQLVKIAFNMRSIEVDDEEIRLAVDLS